MMEHQQPLTKPVYMNIRNWDQAGIKCQKECIQCLGVDLQDKADKTSNLPVNPNV